MIVHGAPLLCLLIDCQHLHKRETTHDLHHLVLVCLATIRLLFKHIWGQVCPSVVAKVLASLLEVFRSWACDGFMADRKRPVFADLLFVLIAACIDNLSFNFAFFPHLNISIRFLRPLAFLRCWLLVENQFPDVDSFGQQLHTLGLVQLEDELLLGGLACGELFLAFGVFF